jgi:hypothetical protein
MAKITIIFFIIISFFRNNAQACSIQVMDLQMKNQLIMAAANQFNIAFEKVTKMKADNFSHRLYGPTGDSSCENFLEFKSDITINYKPNILTECELKVETVLTQNMHAEEYPFEEYSFNLPISSCSRIIRRPIDIGRHIQL